MIVPALLAAVAAPPAALKPTGPWVVRAEESMCLLERSYPVGDRKIALIFQPLLDLPMMEMFVLEDENKPGRQYAGTFDVAADPGARTHSGSYLSVMGKSSDGKATKFRLTRLSANRTMLDELKDGDTLRVRAKPVDRSFAIVRPDQARVALAKCVANLKAAWGIDPADHDRTATLVEGNPAQYFSSDAYPQEALRQGIYGRVIALLVIDATGAVANCRILSSAGAALNAGTCKAATRVRFKPARDMDGNPLPSRYVLPVRWVLPGTPG